MSNPFSEFSARQVHFSGNGYANSIDLFLMEHPMMTSSLMLAKSSPGHDR